MANTASNYTIGGNDEHGLNPATLGKRTPVLPYLNRQVYENEFNGSAKRFFLMACLRCGYNIYDVKPEVTDVSLSTRVVRVNAQNLSALVTFAYNAGASANSFTSANGLEVYYSTSNTQASKSLTLATDVYNQLINGTTQLGRGVKTLNVSMLSSVNCPACLVEAGFMTNFLEAKFMLDPDFQMEVGEEACQGVCDFLNVEYIEPFTTTTGLPTLKYGSQGRSVQFLQYALIQNGYSPQGADGYFGSNTLTAVKEFQTDNNLTIDGVVGPNTWQYLLVLNPENKVLSKGNTGSYVRYLQQKLTAKLYSVGDIDGVFGTLTDTAVKEFQAENGLTVDGVVGPNTWAVLMPIGAGRPYPSS